MARILEKGQFIAWEGPGAEPGPWEGGGTEIYGRGLGLTPSLGHVVEDHYLSLQSTKIDGLDLQLTQKNLII